MTAHAPQDAEMREAVVGDDDAGDRLDRFLARRLAELSRMRIKALIEEGAVSVAGRTVANPSYRVKPGEPVAVRLPPPVDATPQPQAIGLDILYEDDQVIVIDKPAGLVVHPAPGNPDRTLVNALLAHCGDSVAGIGGVRRPGIVHRLDKDTSGLMVAAKTEAAHHALVEQFQARTIERRYLALVWGVPRTRQGRIEGAIGRDPRNRKKMSVLTRGGRPAVTRYEVVETFGDVAALVRCRLETGRTHQIRVHLAHIGHPVVGDPVYGRARRGRLAALSDALRERCDRFGRQALHAEVLGFRHPATQADLHFERPCPDDMEQLIEAFRHGPGRRKVG